MDAPELWTVANLAERWQISRQRVHQLISEGRLHPMRIGKVLAFSNEEVLRFEAERRKTAKYGSRR
jgi:predicted site-specific integrase-resolvase